MELLIGLILPPVIDYLNKHVSNEAEKFVVACLTCLVVAVGVDWRQISAGDASGLPQTAAIVFAESTVIFNLYWKNSFLRDKLQGSPSS